MWEISEPSRRGLLLYLVGTDMPLDALVKRYGHLAAGELRVHGQRKYPMEEMPVDEDDLRAYYTDDPKEHISDWKGQVERRYRLLHRGILWINLDRSTLKHPMKEASDVGD